MVVYFLVFFPKVVLDSFGQICGLKCYIFSPRENRYLIFFYVENLYWADFVHELYWSVDLICGFRFPLCFLFTSSYAQSVHI